MINERDDNKIVNGEVLIVYDLLKPIKKKLFEGLELRYEGNYDGSLKCYPQHLLAKSNTGFEAGKYLAYKALACKSSDAKEAHEFEREANEAYTNANKLSLKREI